MNSPVENILLDLFNTTSLKDVSAEQLLKLIEDEPYNGVSYFLLAKKLYTSKEAGYESALQKAALHFPNSLWFNYNLNADEENPTISVEEIHESIPVDKQNGTTTEVEAAQTGEEIIDTNIEENNVIEKPGLLEEILPDASEEELADEEELANEEELTDENADDSVNERLSNMLQQQASAFEKPVEATAELPIENMPYHRVDYFDSQGIKLEEPKTDDKLGAQLKRFTDWLKQMKRVNPNPAELAKDEAGESKVQTMAEHSNESGEIATEAMAEVLIKQGKPEQAVQIYEKLSFNNPSKSAYFAAKIKELKG